MTTLSFFVPGKAAPQGSKRHVGRGIMVESSKEVAPWREAIRWECRRVAGPGCLFPRGTAVSLSLEFVLPRPKSAPKRSTPPAVTRPDADKLARAAGDAIGSAGVWNDDSQVTDLHVTKRIAEIDEVPGVHVVIRSAVAAEAAA
jgi:crossover junction endodeoxyribonuclease RusA